MRPKTIISGSGLDRPPTKDGLLSALDEAEQSLEDRFVIIEIEGQRYMQCLARSGGWQLEKREGDDQRHFQACKSQISGGLATSSDLMKIFSSRNERVLALLDRSHVEEVMLAYLCQNEEPSWLFWERVSL